jgi:hypothetical protein
MWDRIDQQLPIDYIVLHTLCSPGMNARLLPGFALVRELDEPDIRAQLYRRETRPRHAMMESDREGNIKQSCSCAAASK